MQEFHRRIEFCLELHNSAVKGMRYSNTAQEEEEKKEEEEKVVRSLTPVSIDEFSRY